MSASTLRPSAARVAWALQLLAAAILAQTLFFKFTGARESVFIFQTLGAEPWGRLATGAAELVAVVLLLVPRTAAIGALLTIALMLGAIFSHLTQLGIAIEVDGESDGGLLFGLALTALLAATIVAWLRRTELPIVGGTFARAG